MGKFSRDKGARFERQWRDSMREAGFPARRNPQAQGGRVAGADVVGCGPFHVECKTGKRPNVRAALAQACDDASTGMVPAAVCHWDRGETIVAMRAEDWLDLVREWHERGEA